MSGGRTYERHGRWVYRDPRWTGLRLAAKRRDSWCCVQCGSRHGLEVDHIEPVRTAPDRAFDLTNPQTLCGKCHGTKTRRECGHPELSPQRQAWRDLIRAMQRGDTPSPTKKEETDAR